MKRNVEVKITVFDQIPRVAGLEFVSCRKQGQRKLPRGTVGQAVNQRALELREPPVQLRTLEL